MGRVLGIVVLLLLISPKSSFASITVDVLGNGEGSKSKVTVESNVKSSTTTNQNFKSTTDIRIETNGEVKEYHGNDESIHIESGDGNNSVSIKNDVPDKDSSASADMDKEFNLLEFIKQQLDSIFTFFKS